MNAVPVVKGQKVEQRNTATRYEQLSAAKSQQVNLPDLGGMDYLVNIANEIGIARQAPVDWSEINSYCNATGIELTPWESRMVRLMSSSYVSQSVKSTDPACAPPYFNDTRTDEERHTQVHNKLLASLKPRGKRK